jgi:iron-sulfur cluster repair protein YtfE (RIC family)
MRRVGSLHSNVDKVLCPETGKVLSPKRLRRLSRFEIDFSCGAFRDILAAIKREEKNLDKQLSKLQHQLTGIRAAAKALGDSTT